MKQANEVAYEDLLGKIEAHKHCVNKDLMNMMRDELRTEDSKDFGVQNQELPEKATYTGLNIIDYLPIEDIPYQAHFRISVPSFQVKPQSQKQKRKPCNYFHLV